MNSEPKPHQEPQTYSLADFLAEVSRDAEIDQADLSRRTEPLDQPDDLLAMVRETAAEQQREPVSIEALESDLDLQRQYFEQQAVLAKYGILNRLRGGEIGIWGMDGQPYPFPSYERITAALAERQELIEIKVEQGFTKLLVVPFGASLDYLRAAYGRALVHHQRQVGLTDSNGQPLEVNESEPVCVWVNFNNADVARKIVYYPYQFNSQQHGGLTKKDILLSANQKIVGWEVLLVEDMPDIPAEGAGATVGGRPQLEAGNSPSQYLDILRREGIYEGETTITPETWLTYALSHLDQTSQVVDDPLGNGKISYLTGAYFHGSDRVPDAYWDRGVRQASLLTSVPESADQRCGVRSAVRIA